MECSPMGDICRLESNCKGRGCLVEEGFGGWAFICMDMGLEVAPCQGGSGAYVGTPSYGSHLGHKRLWPRGVATFQESSKGVLVAREGLMDKRSRGQPKRKRGSSWLLLGYILPMRGILTRIEFHSIPETFFMVVYERAKAPIKGGLAQRHVQASLNPIQTRFQPK